MHIIDTCLAEQSKLFEKLLSEALQREPQSLVGPSCAELARPCSTLVMRPQAELAQSLGARIAEVEKLFPGQLYYGAENLHMTVSALPDVAPRSMLHRHLRRSLASHVGAIRVMTMPVGGFGIIGSAVIIKAYDVEGLLARMVRCLVADIEEEGFAMKHLADLHMKIFWITAARLIQPPSAEFLDYISKHHNDNFGVANFETIELDQTDSIFSAAATEILEKYNLGDLS